MMATSKTTTTSDPPPLPHPARISVTRPPPGARCEVHELPDGELGETIVVEISRRGHEGICVCKGCVTRARQALALRVAARRAAEDGRAFQWPAGTSVRLWPRRWRAGVYHGEPTLTRTTSESWRADARELVCVHGEPGGIDVRRLEVIR